MTFFVPKKIEAFRVLSGPLGSDFTAGNNGAFILPPIIGGRDLMLIVSDGRDWQKVGLDGEPWEHVSVHIAEGKRSLTPTWKEMAYVKDLFWDPEDVVMQLHPARSQYVNNHEHTLHLWRPTISKIPLPPAITVGLLGPAPVAEESKS